MNSYYLPSTPSLTCHAQPRRFLRCVVMHFTRRNLIVFLSSWSTATSCTVYTQPRLLEIGSTCTYRRLHALCVISMFIRHLYAQSRYSTPISSLRFNGRASHRPPTEDPRGHPPPSPLPAQQWSSWWLRLVWRARLLYRLPFLHSQATTTEQRGNARRNRRFSAVFSCSGGKLRRVCKEGLAHPRTVLAR